MTKTIKIHWGYKAARLVHFRIGFWALALLGRGHIGQHWPYLEKLDKQLLIPTFWENPASSR